MAELPEDFPVHRFVRDLFDDLTLTLPALGCAFRGSLGPNAVTAHGPSLGLKNKLFLLFADLATASPTLWVQFMTQVRGPNLVLEFHCHPFDAASAASLPCWDQGLFELLSPDPSLGFGVTLPVGLPLEAGPPVHWQQLAQRFGGPENGRLVLDQFLIRCRILLPDLESAIANADSPNVLRAAHTLKGSAKGVTADALAEAAQELETLGRSGDLGGAPELYKALLVTYDEFIRWVREGQT